MNLDKRTCSLLDCKKPLYCRAMCQMHYWRCKYFGDPNRERTRVKCSYPNCERHHKAKGLCSLHYCRQKKGISLDFKKPILAKKRYKLVKKEGHYLADKLGRVYLHRLVFYEQIGKVRVPCFWCGDPLEWRINLCVDHLNHDRHDNRIENLRPSCSSCNSGRTISNSHVRQSVYSAGK